ncbi:hypothetical protein D3C85_1531390 [compost metagenome]
MLPICRGDTSGTVLHSVITSSLKRTCASGSSISSEICSITSATSLLLLPASGTRIACRKSSSQNLAS